MHNIWAPSLAVRNTNLNPFKSLKDLGVLSFGFFPLSMSKKTEVGEYNRHVKGMLPRSEKYEVVIAAM